MRIFEKLSTMTQDDDCLGLFDLLLEDCSSPSESSPPSSFSTSQEHTVCAQTSCDDLTSSTEDLTSSIEDLTFSSREDSQIICHTPATSRSSTPEVKDTAGEVTSADDDWDSPSPEQIQENDGDLKDDEDQEEETTCPLEQIREAISKSWNDRNYVSRYKHVYALLIQWEEHDLNEIDSCVQRYEETFRDFYNYNVKNFKIPMTKSYRALARRLMDLTDLDNPDTLFIIWYDGHGRENPDRRGPPHWFSHGDYKQASSVDSGVISSIMGDCDADILLINNSCSSLTCDRFNGKGVVETISASAFNTTTGGSLYIADDLSPSMTWAADSILRDRKTIEKGITIPELHRKICLGTQWAASGHVANYRDLDNEDEPENKDGRTQPVYTRLSADPAGPGGRTRGIVLQRLEWHDDFYIPKKTLAWEQILIRLDVEKISKIDVAEWTSWIASAPAGVDWVTVNKEEKEEVKSESLWGCQEIWD
ncbi:hypothetical protein F5Y16DRAFT_371876 [Xylariaceae sp. FL0255]|nr:hypothetical protein F5Y16DRAFT_371876 [Xylariaceae sp. FL0255]